MTGSAPSTAPSQIAPAPAASSASTRIENIPLGILFMIGATVMFALSSAFAKWQVSLYPVGEVMAFRSISSLLVCSLFVLPFTGVSVFATKKPGQHIARGFSQAISQTLTVLAVSMMPIAGAIAIGFSAPLFAALISVLWLGERAGWARWGALLLGFAGVLIVTEPGADSLQLGALFALGNAVMYGSVTVAVRGMTKTESANTLLMWQMLTMSFFHSFLLLFGFRMPTGIDALMLVGTGVCNAVQQYCWTKALHLAPTTAVSPFYYMTLVWAIVIGFFVWGDQPTVALLAGSAIVIASGLFLLWHEGRLRRAKETQATPTAAAPPAKAPEPTCAAVLPTVAAPAVAPSRPKAVMGRTAG
ncbi:DMT family transporter [Rhodoplanes roseus]|uniref:EamA family transporter n=1 Tax=Rhodoplanes roseus TaxID=29409 RepID=A0A327L6M5_9BRAD|nr:DMT family transporter [Rhodoplanes roseus]RAI45834.1 EamA family transporter [Rhodoplanes roseus]